MTIYQGFEHQHFPALKDWSDEFRNRKYVIGGDEIIASWQVQSDEFNENWQNKKLDIAYGEDERHKFDLFFPKGQSPKGSVIFIHGGYWMSQSRHNHRHLAKGVVENNLIYAAPSYRLCPQVRISDIVKDIQNAIQAIAAEVNDIPIILTGHSAGGHLCAKAAEIGFLQEKIQKRVKAIVPISGLFDLRTLLMADLNDTLKLDEAEAIAHSPIFKRVLENVIYDNWVGGAERPEFIRQSRLMTHIWNGLGLESHLHILHQQHHFNIICGLQDKNSALLSCFIKYLD